MGDLQLEVGGEEGWGGRDPSPQGCISSLLLSRTPPSAGSALKSHSPHLQALPGWQKAHACMHTRTHARACTHRHICTHRHMRAHTRALPLSSWGRALLPAQSRPQTRVQGRVWEPWLHNEQEGKAPAERSPQRKVLPRAWAGSRSSRRFLEGAEGPDIQKGVKALRGEDMLRGGGAPEARGRRTIPHSSLDLCVLTVPPSKIQTPCPSLPSAAHSPGPIAPQTVQAASSPVLHCLSLRSHRTL